MQIRICLLFCVAAFIIFAQCASHELTPEELLKIRDGKSQDNWFIKFYGPNCGFCKAMADEWEAFAQLVEEEEYDLKIGSFDAQRTDFDRQPFRDIFPGPLPGLHFFPADKPKHYYEFPNPRIIVDKNKYLDFAVLGYEDTKPVYRQAKYLYEEESNIVTIPGEQFDEVVSSGEKYFVMFFGPKCGACKNFLPTWEKFAEESVKRGSPWITSRVDGFSAMSVVDRYTARPWPSLVFIEDGKFYRMDTDIVRATDSIDEIFDWIESGTYKTVGEEFSGEDTGLAYYKKLREAKEKSKKKKNQQEL